VCPSDQGQTETNLRSIKVCLESSRVIIVIPPTSHSYPMIPMLSQSASDIAAVKDQQHCIRSNRRQSAKEKIDQELVDAGSGQCFYPPSVMTHKYSHT
jgi:hypothetical protein